MRWAAGFFAASAISLLARRRRALTRDGAVAATAVGTCVFAVGGLPAAVALNVFFVSGSALSRLKAREKVRRGLAQAKGGERDAGQVLANGGPAMVALLLGAMLGRPAAGQTAFVGALAAASADTWATELGMLSPHRPQRITTGQPVLPGTSGGITPLGLLASTSGAAAVALAWRSGGGHAAWAPVVLAGLAGSLFDSLLGDTVQAAYVCSRCGASLEQPWHATDGADGRLVRGYPWMNNDTVNLLATLVGGVCGLLVGATREQG